MSYIYANFADIKASLSEILSDSGQVFWTPTELGIIINAALREWSAMSRMFRDRGTFPTNSSSIFYDLTSVLKNGANEAFLAPVVTDAQLLQQAKFALMELNPDDATTFSDGLSALQFNESFVRRRNQFLLETGLIITQTTAQVIPSGGGRVQFASDSIIDVRRATWTTLDSVTSVLFREDGFTAGNFTPTWPQSTGTPRRYSIYPDPLLTLQLLPPPTDNGTLTLQTISSGVVLDDFTPFILWGVLSDVLSSTGPSNDLLRAEYAEHRFGEGVAVGQQVATLLQAFINGVPCSISSLFDYDTFSPNWMTRGVPRGIGALGSNLIAVTPAANGIYSVMIDSVRNAPQLVNATDLLPIGREYLDLILNYAAHLASFKQGGAEFQATMPAYNDFVKAAVGYNNRMNAQNLEFETLVDRAQAEEQELSLRKVG